MQCRTCRRRPRRCLDSLRRRRRPARAQAAIRRPLGPWNASGPPGGADHRGSRRLTRRRRAPGSRGAAAQGGAVGPRLGCRTLTPALTPTPTWTLTEDQRFGAALAALGAPPGTLRRLLEGYGPAEAWEALARGRHRADPGRRYRRKAVPETLDGVVSACERSNVSV